eukprot:6900416-Ditylum_brightwellii.AAC.1
MDAKRKATFGILKLNSTAYIKYIMHITDQLGRYSMILGSNVLQEQGIDLDFKENSITLGDYQANMKSANVTLAEHLDTVEAT